MTASGTADAAEWFRSRGVQYLQGFHFARPAAIPPREFALRDASPRPA